ncbi:MAG TPA: response regulator transcription factor, partial [Pseudomonadales bacterium]|nr:response regulator transcription factor [Pseudomonadales bacterium]
TAAQARAILAAPPHPDLILLDLHLPDESGKSLLRECVQHAVPVLILSALGDSAAMHAMMDAGACGFVCKTQSAAEIIKACAQVLNGESYLPPFIQTAAEVAGLDGINLELAKNNGLTRRQMEVLRLLAMGLQNKIICDRLHLTEDTVKSHLKQLFGNLNVRNRTECVAKARQLGIVTSNWLV